MDLVSFRYCLKALSCLLLELNKERRMEGFVSFYNTLCLNELPSEMGGLSQRKWPSPANLLFHGNPSKLSDFLHLV